MGSRVFSALLPPLIVLSLIVVPWPRLAPAFAAKAPAERPPGPLPATPATAPDAEFCGVLPGPALLAPDERDAPPSCVLPGLPCGPVPADQIGPSGAEPQEDLDGDGHADIVLAGRRDKPRLAAYGLIYLWRPGG